jgi:protein-S-isoprenylcysteine O-methyltransferase Ste14
LRRDGVYGLVRHPMYGGALLVVLAWALSSSPLALPPWIVAAAFLDAKRRREEEWLQEQYSDYIAYKTAVARQFIPFVW